MKTTTMRWRLKEPPTTANLGQLLKDGVLDKEEVKQILFSYENEEDRDKKSLESEVKFLRELVEKLSSNRGQVIEIIKQVQTPYISWGWYQPYQVWCQANDLNTVDTNGNTWTNNLLNSAQCNFTAIQTF